MKKDEARKLVEELESLIGDYPGRNDRRLERARSLIDQLMWGQVDGYLREKASTALEFLGYWFSQRKWQQWGSVERIHHLVLIDLVKLDDALDGHFHES